MEDNYYKKYEPVFGSWRITRKIGEGQFGKVFALERNEFGAIYKAALKVITVPQNESEIKSIMTEGMSRENVTQYYKGIVRDILNEFILMSQLKGSSNIVSYEDHAIFTHENGIGWDILIRMELLNPLTDILAKKSMSREEVIKFGIDMCSALELCEQKNIIHRDIKPENIFLSDLGSYKLGDFGVARTVEKTASEMSKKGTYTYMAPEVFRGEAYDRRADIYSLGIVMYRMLNMNRTPFLPNAPKSITYQDKENAIFRRMKGERIPKPQNGEEEISRIIQKACEFRQEDRYYSASEMKEDLIKLSRRERTDCTGVEINRSKAFGTGNCGFETNDRDRTKQQRKRTGERTGNKNKSKGFTIIIIVAVAVVLAAAVAAFGLFYGKSDKVNKKHNINKTETFYDSESGKKDSEKQNYQNNENRKYGYIRIMSAEASSQLVEKKHGVYYAEDVYDNDLDSPWCENAEGTGVGEWIEVNFNDNCKISELEVYNGLMKSKKLLTGNAQIKTALLEFSDGSRQKIKLSRNFSLYAPEKIKIIPVETAYIILTIESIYEGKRFDDTCLSELRVKGFGENTVDEKAMPKLFHSGL